MPTRKDKVSKLDIAGELLQAFWQNKWWGLTPLLVLLMIVALLAIFAQSSAIAPFIYTLF